MTKKAKNLLYLLIFVSFLLKEEVYHFLFAKEFYLAEYEMTTYARNKTLEKKEEELYHSYGYLDSIPYSLEPSKILINNLYHLTDEIIIYKGEEDHIKKNHLVINDLGLVGIVSKTKKHSSHVRLLLNDETSISVKINDSYGILKCKDQELYVEGIKAGDTLSIGDQVYTSDLSLYPENVLIGSIEAIETDRYQIEHFLKIKPSVHFDDLKYLSIITDLRGDS